MQKYKNSSIAQSTRKQIQIALSFFFYACR